MDDLTDEELMLMFQYGDVEAFSLLFDKYRQPLWRYLFHLCGNIHTAEDLLQEVFVKIATHAGSYRHEGKVCAWFYRIAGNHYLNFRNSAAHGRQGKIVVLEDLDSKERCTRMPVDIVETEEFRQILQGKIGSLPQRQREIYVLYEMEGKTYQEISAIVDIPVGTVKTLLHRGP